MGKQEYVDSVGRVPRGMAAVNRTQQLRMVLLMRLVQQLGGRVEVLGLGSADEINALLRDYEIKASGTGHGSVIVEVVRKP